MLDRCWHIIAAALLGHAVAVSARPLEFRVSIDSSLQPDRYSGRVYVAIHDGEGEPRTHMGRWHNPMQVIAADVKDLEPGRSVTLDGSNLSFPAVLSDVVPGRYTLQAIVRNNPDSPIAGRGSGDLVSRPVRMELDPGADLQIDLRVDQVVPYREFRETDRVRLVEIDSALLTAFYGRPMKLRAGVVLPPGWVDDPDITYPMVYSITGFGGDHFSAHGVARTRTADRPAANAIFVVPDPSSYRGHTTFANSDNNGPRGDALVRELIPHIDARFRGAGPEHRYVTGGSSGGWSSLWLQITYPDEFRGCWAHVPDPVDFRDFQRINLYAAGANMYRDETGKRRPLARRAGEVVLWYDRFVEMETVLGPGGQIHAFEAVFSPRGPDGQPIPLFDRATGAVDPAVAKAWERYDIRLVLERRWPMLGPKLTGKLHVYAGEVDTFYLEGAAALLRDSLDALGSDAVVEVVPGMGHSTHVPGQADMERTIAENWARAHPPASRR